MWQPFQREGIDIGLEKTTHLMRLTEHGIAASTGTGWRFLWQCLGYRMPADVESELWSHQPAREIIENKANT
ncbi:hypothetical protein [Corynebacterium pseudodiphtheriticum]|uniref:Uncharacterized protein n=1 Tax=Corynebacterium pseudodiphtheriticum TaxID=37637 RepID=A0ABT7FYM4_9CORY|nr:hypothetical protein [Corynebacterium pseudodiphtheriticum]MDK4290848.1 hypothetical protein [Corynebacterium pseudodiphtheriticum]MDK4322526.1 hypothetical protein [Corynebacterium pseudodiphtheriticum]